MTRALATSGLTLGVALLAVTAAEARPSPPTAPKARAALALGVATKSPDAVGTTTATLRMRVTASVLGAGARFQYGTTDAYGSVSTQVTTALLGLDEEITIAVSGLLPDTKYHFRAVVTQPLFGSTYGADRDFKTDKVKETTTPPAGTTAPPAASTTPPAPGTTGSPPTDPAPTGTGRSDDDDDGDDDGSGASGSPPRSAPRDTDAPTVTAGIIPVLGRSVVAGTTKGTVTIVAPDGRPLDLSRAAALPTGTIVDTTRGTVELTTAVSTRSATQTGSFWGGIFEVRQTVAGKGLTQLVLRGGDFRSCPAPAIPFAAASVRHVAQPVLATAAAARRKPPRSLWGSDRGGRFQTRGRGSVATVRGTRWLTQDWCRGTVTTVFEGAVSVRDLTRGRTVTVRRGGSYLARTGA